MVIGELADKPPGRPTVHGLLDEEVAPILALFDEWGETDRSHRELAHRRSYLGQVWVSPSSAQLLIYFTTHFTRAHLALSIIEDLLSRKWITEVVSAEGTSTQVEVAFTDALEIKRLRDAVQPPHET